MVMKTLANVDVSCNNGTRSVSFQTVPSSDANVSSAGCRSHGNAAAPGGERSGACNESSVAQRGRRSAIGTAINVLIV